MTIPSMLVSVMPYSKSGESLRLNRRGILIKVLSRRRILKTYDVNHVLGVTVGNE